jgi:membrane protein YqaA with SNARE-associated domain
MHELVQPLTDWSIQILEQFGMIGLFIFSFTESLFHPIPVDPILIAMEAMEKWSTSSLFFWATIGSILGGLLAHYAGSTFGKKVFLKVFTEKRFETGKKFMEKWGVWSVIFVAITPLPFKVIAWMAGILHMNRIIFFIAETIGRAGRFMLVLWIFDIIQNW